MDRGAQRSTVHVIAKSQTWLKQFIGASQVELVVIKLSANASKHKRYGFIPCIGKIPSRRKWQSTPVFLPGKSHELRSLVGYSPWVANSQTQLFYQSLEIISDWMQYLCEGQTQSMVITGKKVLFTGDIWGQLSMYLFRFREYMITASKFQSL